MVTVLVLLLIDTIIRTIMTMQMIMKMTIHDDDVEVCVEKDDD